MHDPPPFVTPAFQNQVTRLNAPTDYPGRTREEVHRINGELSIESAANIAQSEVEIRAGEPGKISIWEDW